MSERRPPDTQILVRFEGRVQGVGFRFTTKEIASSFRVTGYVANLPDGSVQLVAEGSKDEVERFLRAIRSSHLGDGIVEQHDRLRDASGRYKGFSIRYDPDYAP